MRKKFWILIGVGALFFLVLIIAANVIDVGERLEGIHPALAYLFYALSLLVLFFLVLNPLRVIFLAPTFSIDALEDAKNTRTYRRAARRLMHLPATKDEEKKVLKAAMRDEAALKEAIKKTFNGSVKEEVDAAITHHAKTVLVTTAISQNGNLDMLSVIFTNIRMVRDIVRACGFRPSYAHLGKLALRVAIIAMVAENLEDVDIKEALPSRVSDTMRDVPFVRTATNSAFQGISNGMLTARVGIVTRKFLFQEHKLANKREMRLAAFKESFILMPKIVGGGFGAFPKGIMHFMVRPFTKKPFAKKGNQV